jgi:hypothetical protein
MFLFSKQAAKYVPIFYNAKVITKNLNSGGY